MYWTNPQCSVTLSLKNSVDSKVSLIISLMQTDSARRRAATDGSFDSSNVPIHFEVFKVTDSNQGTRTKKYTSDDLDRVYAGSPYINQRSISARLNLEPGSYVIIPSTFDANVAAEFIVRVFIESSCDNMVNLKTSTNNITDYAISNNRGTAASQCCCCL